MGKLGKSYISTWCHGIRNAGAAISCQIYPGIVSASSQLPAAQPSAVFVKCLLLVAECGTTLIQRG